MWMPTKTEIVVTPFEKPLAKSNQTQIAEEAYRLLQLLAPGEKHNVRFGETRS
jgi:hypothetical protein